MEHTGGGLTCSANLSFCWFSTLHAARKKFIYLEEEDSAAEHPEHGEGSETTLATVSKFLQRKTPKLHHNAYLQENLGIKYPLFNPF